MKTIEIKIKNKNKTINNQSIDQILSGLNFETTDIDELRTLLEEINSEEDLIIELKKILKLKTPITVLKYIMYIGNLSISEANPLLEKVMMDNLSGARL